MKSYYIAILSAYIASLTGYILAGVNEPVFCNPNDVLSQYAPVKMFLLVATPALLGWLIGHTKEGERNA